MPSSFQLASFLFEERCSLKYQMHRQVLIKYFTINQLESWKRSLKEPWWTRRRLLWSSVHQFFTTLLTYFIYNWFSFTGAYWLHMGVGCSNQQHRDTINISYFTENSQMFARQKKMVFSDLRRKRVFFNNKKSKLYYGLQ